MTRLRAAAVVVAICTGWMTKPGQGLAALLLVLVVIVACGLGFAAHRRGVRRLERAGLR